MRSGLARFLHEVKQETNTILVLTRKTNQSIIIGDPNSDGAASVVTVTAINGDSVRLGVEAPADVVVDRSLSGSPRRSRSTSRAFPQLHGALR